MELRAGRTVGWALGASLVVTVVAVSMPGSSAMHDPELHLLLEVAGGLVALLVAYLMLGRFRQERRGRDLALSISLGMLATSHLFYSALPTALGDGEPDAFAVWAAMPSNLLAGIVFIVSARFADRRLSMRTGTVAIWLAAAGMLAMGLGAALLAPDTGMSAARGPAGSIVHAIGLIAFSCIAVVFVRRSRHGGDGLIAWIAVSAVFAAAGRLNFLLVPTLYTSDVGPGDAFRLLAHVALLIGATKEIGVFWRAQTTAAIAGERRRIAREVHDGIAQELAYISRRAAAVGSPEIQSAAGRALTEARLAMAALRESGPESFTMSFENALKGAAARVGASVTVTLDPAVEVCDSEADALVRVGAEAVTNAGRMCNGGHVEVQLVERDGELRLLVRDRGPGLASMADRSADGSGLGLAGMAERAAAIGAELTLRPRSGGGTEVELVRR